MKKSKKILQLETFPIYKEYILKISGSVLITPLSTYSRASKDAAASKIFRYTFAEFVFIILKRIIFFKIKVSW